MPGFPNMFWIVGPNTGLGHNSMVFMIEAQINYLLDALETMERSGATEIEVRRDACDAYNTHLQSRLDGTVWDTGGCSSWYHRHQQHRYVVAHRVGETAVVIGADQLAGFRIGAQRRMALGAGQYVEQPVVNLHGISRDAVGIGSIPGPVR